MESIPIVKAKEYASTYVTNFYPSSEDLRFREIMLTEDHRFWNVTVSCSMPLPDMNEENQESLNKRKRLKLNALNGELISMTDFQ